MPACEVGIPLFRAILQAYQADNEDAQRGAHYALDDHAHDCPACQGAMRQVVIDGLEAAIRRASSPAPATPAAPGARATPVLKPS